MNLTYNKHLQRYEFRLESRDEKDASGRLGLAIASSARLQTAWERKNGGQAPVFHTADIYRAYLLVAYADPQLRDFINAHITSMGGLVPKLTFCKGVYIWHGPIEANGIVYKDIPKRAGFEYCANPCLLPNDAGEDFRTPVWWTASALRASKCLEYADESAQQAITEYQERRQAALDASRAQDSDIDIPVPEGLVPFGYQRAGVAYIAKRFVPNSPVRGVLLGDEMGLGKTVMAALMINYFPSIKRVLVICPSSLKRNWMRELQRWLVRPALIGIADTAYSKVIPNSDIVIANFEVLAKRIDTGRRKQEKGRTKIIYDYRLREALARQPWDLLIIDECHRLKGETTKVIRSRMAFSIPFKFCLLLTGTPMVNRPRELYNLIAHIAPKYFGDKSAFLNRYCAGGGWRREFDGAQNLEELQERMRIYCLIRRLKADVLTDLPPKLRQVIELPAAGCEGLVQKEQLAFASKEDILTNVRLRVELAKASQNPNDYKSAVADLKKGIQVAFEELSRIRKETAIAKIPMVQDHCDSLLESVPKLVVFAHHKEVVYTLAEHFGRECVTLTGDTKLKDRDEAVQSFQNNDAIRVFIGTIGAAGVGLTLTASSYVVFSELSWVPGDITQAEDRCILEEQLVQTESGFVPVQDVKVGDLVLTHRGRWKRVLKTHSRQIRGWETIADIEYERFDRPLRCTSDHPLFIKRGTAQPGWIKAEDIYPRDLLCFPRVRLDRNAWQFRIPTFEPTKASLDWLYLFGWYLAEGYASLGRGRYVSLSGHSDEIPILEQLNQTVHGGLGLMGTIRDRRPKKNAAELRICSNEFADWMAAQFGRTCKNKHIPTWLYGLYPKQTLALLRGYWDGDGEEKKQAYQKWVTSAPQLGTQIAQLSAACGYSPSMHSEINESGTTMWRGRCALGGQPRGARDDEYIYYLIKSVKHSIAPQRENGKRLRVYDLTVADDHSFIVGMASVHNCHRIGTKDNVTIQHLVLEGSLDKRMADVLVEKQEIADRALDRDTKGAVLDEPITPAREQMATQGVTVQDVAKIADELTRADVALVQYGLQLLAGAHRDSKKIDIRFRAIDAPLGTHLAQLKKITTREAALGKKLLSYYRTQLAALVPDIQPLWERKKK